jgi:tetratricopeptide (TPR) repeat protein
MSRLDDPTAATMPASASTVEAPDDGERYLLRDRLGEGAMGVVWRAHDRTLDREVALKLLHDRFLGDDHQARLAAEARAMARLSHPNVVGVYDAGVQGGRAYLTMELVRGATLARWLATPRGWREVVDVFAAAADGLAAAHAAGILHRDVKPANILVGDDGVARVADFGVASAGAIPVDAGGAVTAATTGIVGSPAYLSPQRLRGEPAVAADDQFAFCVSLHEALDGERPFAGATLAELATSIERGPPPPRGVPGWLRAVIARGLAADPAARFPSMAALAEALRRRPRWPRLAAGGGAMLLAGVVAYAVTGGDDERTCPAGAAELASVWNADARARLGAVFDALDAPHAAGTRDAITGALDRYAAGWIAAHDDACAATRSAELLDRQRLCLGLRRRALAATIDALAGVDRASLDDATAVIEALPAIADCADPARLAAVRGSPGSPEAKLREDLIDASVLLHHERTAEGLALARQVIAAAEASGDPAALAEARFLLARGLAQNGELTPAADAFGAAAAAYAEVGDPGSQAIALARQAYVLKELGVFRDAQHVLELADAALATDPSPTAEVEVRDIRGHLLAEVGDYAGAAAQWERVRARHAQISGERSSFQTEVLGNLSAAAGMQGDYGLALRYAREALDIARQLGEAHPYVADARRGVADALTRLERHDEARAEIAQALAIARAAHGEQHVQIAEIEASYARIEARAGDARAEAAHLERAVTIREALAPDAVETQALRGDYGASLAALGRIDEGLAILEDALPRLEGLLGPLHPSVAGARIHLGLSLVQADRLDEAAAAFTAAAEALDDIPLGQANALAYLAAVERLRGRPAEALAHDQRSLDLQLPILGDQDVDVAFSRVALASDHLALGAPDLALPLAEAGLAVLATDPGGRPLAQWAVARALLATGGDRARARALAAEVLAALDADPRLDAELSAARAAIARAAAE